jgi:hypothetical protein
MLQIKGGPPAPQLASEIGATFDIENMATENRNLAGYDRFGAAIQQVAVAANRGAIRFRNPRGSLVVAIFEVLRICNQNAGNDQPLLQMALTTTDLANVLVTSGEFLDPRGRDASALIVSRDAPGVAPTLGNSVSQVTLLAQTTYDFIWSDRQEIPLLPGMALQFITAQVNVSLTGSFVWRERMLEESEVVGSR